MTTGDESLTLADLRTTARTLRLAAVGDLRAQREQWPHVADGDFEAVVSAVGEISVDEAHEVLTRLERSALGFS